MYRRDLLASVAASAGAGALAGVGRGGRRAATQGDDGDAFEPLGVLDLEGTRELAVSEDGSLAYLAVDDGIATVDLSDPSDPTVLAEERGLLADDTDGPLRLVWDVWPDGDRLLAAGPANGLAGSSLHAAVLFDVSDPAAPELLDAHRTEFPIHNCFFRDDLAYLTANGAERTALVMLDAADGTLAERTRWSISDHDERWTEVPTAAHQLHDVYVQDDVAYLPYWDAGTWLLDVSDPDEPSYLGHTSVHDVEELAELDPFAAVLGAQTPPGNSHYVEVDETGDLMAVGREAWAFEAEDCRVGGAAGVDLYDVSEPASIEHLATIEPPESYLQTSEGPFTTSHNLELVDDRLYTSWYFGGVQLHDVSDPSEPRELAWWRDPDEAAFWTARRGVAGEFFVASSAHEAAGYASHVQGRVYTFPDRAGEQPDPPSLTDAPEGVRDLPECERSASELASGANDSGGSSGDDGGDDGSEDTDDSLPGFGAGAALTGLGLGAGWLRRRARDDGRDDDR